MSVDLRTAACRFILFLVVLVLMGGCTTVPSPQTPAPAISATENPTFTPASTKSPFPAPTRTPSWTPILTPEGDDAGSKLRYLVETNGGCSLPCYWGIVPGRTTWAEVNALLEPFAISISPPELSSVSHDLEIQVASFYDPIDQDGYWQTKFYADRLGQKQGTIEIMEAPAGRALPDLLTDLGVPDEIWVNIETYPLGEPLYTLVLYYDNGVLLFDTGRYTIDDKRLIRICPTQFLPANVITFWLWDPTVFGTFHDIGALTFPELVVSDDLLHPLSEVSEMSPSVFFDTYTDPRTTQCIQMPTSEWFRQE